MDHSIDQTQPSRVSSAFNVDNLTSAVDVPKETYQSPKQIQLNRNLYPGWFLLCSTSSISIYFLSQILVGGQGRPMRLRKAVLQHIFDNCHSVCRPVMWQIVFLSRLWHHRFVGLS